MPNLDLQALVRKPKRESPVALSQETERILEALERGQRSQVSPMPERQLQPDKARP